MDSSLRNRFFVLAAAGLALIALTPRAAAQALPHPVNITPTGATPAGLSSMTTYDARGVPGAANAGYYTRPVTVSNNTLGGLGRGLARRAVPVQVFLAAVDAAGWAIDELTKQVMVPESGDPPPAPGTGVWCVSSGWFSAQPVKRFCGPSPESFIGQSPQWTGGTYTVTAYIPNSSTSGHLQVNNGQVGGMSVQLVEALATDAWIGYAPATEAALAQVADLVKNNPALWNDALRNPDGSVNRNPDVMAEAQALANELASANPSPNPSQAWDSGAQGGPATAPQGATELQFPVFCTWAAKVCELADWLRLDEGEWDEQQLPEFEPNLDVSWNSGFSGGSCPAPVTIDVLGAEVSFPYQPLCDLAVYIKPIVLAGAGFMGLLIVGGFRRA